MDSMVYLSGVRMDGLVDDLQVIATNLANANTTGFKGTVGKFQAVLAAASPQDLIMTPTGGMSLTWPEYADFRLDLSQGPIHRTDRPLDLAIRGDAFFVVETADGPRYTRKGRFFLNSDGEVTDGAGNRVSAEVGALRIPPDAGDITVGPHGEVSAGGRAIGRIKLVDVPQPDALVAVGWANYRNDGPEAKAAVGSEVIQGAVEESNVNAVQEMVALIEVLRAYEATAHILKRVDASAGELIKTA